MILVMAYLSIPVYGADLEMDMDTGDVPASVFLEGDIPVSTTDISIPAPSAILIEKETGTVIYEKNADERLEPASVTKVMTILLIVEALEAGSFTLDDVVPVSAYAASMGGSQVYLEEGEKMSVRDMLKAIVVSSANDAAVAMAEYISGTESAFVAKMNERAVSLGMANTYFCNCTGLLDQPDHLTTARDISLMSRELIRHDMIKEFTTIWMDTLRGGEFGLSNTNKLIYYYDGATGLKTGFTHSAGYCLSATAMRSGVEYIAVVMNGATSADRFESAKTLLSYGFANYTLIEAIPGEALPPVPVTLGEADYVQPVPETEDYLLVSKSTVPTITKSVVLAEGVKAPVTAGQQMGTLTISDGDTILAEVPIVAGDDVARLSLIQVFLSLMGLLFAGA